MIFAYLFVKYTGKHYLCRRKIRYPMNNRIFMTRRLRRDAGLYKGTDISQTVHVHWFSGFI